MTNYIYNTPLPPASGQEIPGCMRRRYARAYQKTPLVFSLFNTRGSHKATMYNEGIGGMYFETETPLTPGTIIHIKLVAPAESNCPDTLCAAEVRWCREIKKRLPERRFGVGVHYRNTVMQ